MKKFLILLSIFVFVFLVFNLTSAGHTPYDYFTRLSDSFLKGRLYLTESPPWLNELIPDGPGKFFVAYPPMPGVALMPFRFFFGNNFYQEYLSQLMGAGIVVFTLLTSWQIKKDKKLFVWSGILSAFGTIMWFLSATGSVWFFGQISAAFFLSGAIYFALSKKSPLVAGLFLGAAYLSRLQTILSFPLFLYLYFDKNWFKRYLLMASGFLPFILFDFYYNFVRFGTILDKGYFLIPGILKEPWFNKGIFNLQYIPNNLRVMFAALPKFSKTFPFITPSWAGLSILITTPAFLYSFCAKIKEKITLFSWLSLVLISLVILSHGSTGFAQFGYRFAVDFYPVLIFLTIKGVAKTGVKWHHWLLLFFGVFVNLWGVIWINKFGWVSF